jgi:S1-C subfamily serine protease
MRVSSLVVSTFTAVLAAAAGAASQDDVLTLRGPGAQIGATFRDTTATSAAGRAGGAVLVDVPEKSPAAMSGMRAGDLVTVFDGVGVRDSRDLKKLIRETPPGRTVSVTVVRDGRVRLLKVTPVPGR